MLLEERGVMRVACLADGTAWALVDPALLQRLQARTQGRLQGLGWGCFQHTMCDRCQTCAGHTDQHSMPPRSHMPELIA